MADQNQHNPNEQDVTDVDRLLSAIADGEATDAQRARFEQLAAGDPTLWRQLAADLESAALLWRGAEDALASALQVELPAEPVAIRGEAQRGRLPWFAAGIGWAAVLVLAALWAISDDGPAESDVLRPVDLPPVEQIMTHDQAYEYYLTAPWVRGPLQPHLTEIVDLPGGVQRYWYLRRIEEYVDVPADVEVRVDDSGALAADPATLRQQTPAPQPGVTQPPD